MLSNPLSERMIEELRVMLSEVEDGLQPSNSGLEKVIRAHIADELQREAISDASDDILDTIDPSWAD